MATAVTSILILLAVSYSANGAAIVRRDASQQKSSEEFDDRRLTDLFFMQQCPSFECNLLDSLLTCPYEERYVPIRKVHGYCCPGCMKCKDDHMDSSEKECVEMKTTTIEHAQTMGSEVTMTSDPTSDIMTSSSLPVTSNESSPFTITQTEVKTTELSTDKTKLVTPTKPSLPFTIGQKTIPTTSVEDSTKASHAHRGDNILDRWKALRESLASLFNQFKIPSDDTPKTIDGEDNRPKNPQSPDSHKLFGPMLNDMAMGDADLHHDAPAHTGVGESGGADGGGGESQSRGTEPADTDTSSDDSSTTVECPLELMQGCPELPQSCTLWDQRTPLIAYMGKLCPGCPTCATDI